MVWVEALLPFENGDLLSTIHQVGMVEKTVSTYIPLPINQLPPVDQNLELVFPSPFKLVNYILYINSWFSYLLLLDFLTFHF